MATEGDWYDIDEYTGESDAAWFVEIEGESFAMPKSQCEINSENPQSVAPNEIWIPNWLAKKEGLFDE